MSELDRYTISWALPDLDTLAPLWQALEAQAEPNFFLSWSWMSTWLQVFKPDCRLLQLHCAGELVGLGLVTVREEIRHGFLRSRVMRLGQTGRVEQDQIWIEYNDLLLHARHADQGPAALMRLLLQRQDWDEFQLGATLSQRQRLYQHSGCVPQLKWSAPTYEVNLCALRQSGQTYLQSLSRNTRYQINRSERLYAEAGGLEFSVLGDADAMLLHWSALADLHQQRWGDQTGQSGFVNPQFVQFHQSLIRRAAAQGQVEFCILKLGGVIIGILYNFIYRGNVYFYLSGLLYSQDAHLKPGLVIHALAVQQYLERGLDRYDFMGGDARYKQSLGQHHGELQLVSYQRPRLALRLEQLGRRIKHRLNTITIRGQHH